MMSAKIGTLVFLKKGILKFILFYPNFSPWSHQQNFITWQVILLMWSCDQSLVTRAFLWEKLTSSQFYKDLTRKTIDFEGWSWFKFNNFGRALLLWPWNLDQCGIRIKLKSQKVLEANSNVCRSYMEKLVGGEVFVQKIFNRVKWIEMGGFF